MEQVLNINDLVNLFKPVVLPGGLIAVFILKEGKEYNQRVGYLGDGTMAVLGSAIMLIGKTIELVVASVLQTTAGKTIFGRSIEQADHTLSPAESSPSNPLPPPAAVVGK